MALLSEDRKNLLVKNRKELVEILGSVVKNKESFWAELIAKEVITSEDKESLTVSHSF